MIPPHQPGRFEEEPGRFEEALRAARPADATEAEAQAASARVWARVSLQEQHESLRSAARPARFWRGRAVIAAVVLTAFGVMWRVAQQPGEVAQQPEEVSESGSVVESGSIAEVGVPDTKLADAVARSVADVDLVLVRAIAESGARHWRGLVAQAVGGDGVARARLRDGGVAARDAILRVAEEGLRVDRAGALALLGAPLRERTLIDRVAALVGQPATRERAVALLTRTSDGTGVRALGDALLAWPEAETVVLVGLKRIANSGRREAAMEVLLRCAQAGHAAAAAAALEVSGPTNVPRVLAHLSQSVTRSDVVVRAVQSAPPRMRSRLVRSASLGREMALRLVGEAGLAEALPVLVKAAQGRDGVLAVASVGWLRRMDSLQSRVELARLLTTVDAGTAVAHGARTALREGSTTQIADLVRRARASYRDRLPALRALCATEREGLEAISRVAVEARMWPSVATALTQCERTEASMTLARLGAARPRFELALTSLVTRLRHGRTDAIDALVYLARERDAAAVVRALRSMSQGSVSQGSVSEALERLRSDPTVGADVERQLRAEPAVGPRRRSPGSTGKRPNSV